MFILLNWWDNETIAEALPVCKEDESGDTLTFDSEEQAERYAEENLNGHWRVVED